MGWYGELFTITSLLQQQRGGNNKICGITIILNDSSIYPTTRRIRGRRGFAHVAPVERFIGRMGNVIVVIYPLTFCRPFTSEVRMD